MLDRIWADLNYFMHLLVALGCFISQLIDCSGWSAREGQGAYDLRKFSHDKERCFVLVHQQYRKATDALDQRCHVNLAKLLAEQH